MALDAFTSKWHKPTWSRCEKSLKNMFSSLETIKLRKYVQYLSRVFIASRIQDGKKKKWWPRARRGEKKEMKRNQHENNWPKLRERRSNKEKQKKTFKINQLHCSVVLISFVYLISRLALLTLDLSTCLLFIQ